jgi:hypothetical protein
MCIFFALDLAPVIVQLMDGGSFDQCSADPYFSGLRERLDNARA